MKIKKNSSKTLIARSISSKYNVSMGLWESVTDSFTPAPSYIAFNGESYAQFPQARFDGDFEIGVSVVPSGILGGVIVGDSAAQNFLLVYTDGKVRLRINSQTYDTLEGVYDFYSTRGDFVIRRVSNALSVIYNGNEIISATESGQFRLNTIATLSAESLFFEGFVYNLSMSGITYANYPDGSESWSMNGEGNLERVGSKSGTLMTLFNVNNSDIKPLEYPLSPNSFNVLILAGQSNMVGRNAVETGIDDDYSNIGNKVFQYNQDGSISLARNPIDFVDVWSNSMGLWLRLCEGLQSSMSDKPILIVPVAKGGTGFTNNNWNPDDDLYNTAVAQINGAMANPNNVMKGFFWLQGETDAGNASNTYLSDINNMWTSMKSDCDSLDDNTPFITGTISEQTVPVYGPIINADIQAFSDSLINSDVVNTTDLTLIDDFHYNSEGLRIIGERMSSVYKNL